MLIEMLLKKLFLATSKIWTRTLDPYPGPWTLDSGPGPWILDPDPEKP